MFENKTLESISEITVFGMYMVCICVLYVCIFLKFCLYVYVSCKYVYVCACIRFAQGFGDKNTDTYIHINKVFASFKPPTGREQARHVRRGKGRVRTQDLGHQSGARYQLCYSPRWGHTYKYTYIQQKPNMNQYLYVCACIQTTYIQYIQYTIS